MKFLLLRLIWGCHTGTSSHEGSQRCNYVILVSLPLQTPLTNLLMSPHSDPDIPHHQVERREGLPVNQMSSQSVSQSNSIALCGRAGRRSGRNWGFMWISILWASCVFSEIITVMNLSDQEIFLRRMRPSPALIRGENITQYVRVFP